jgi:hypothetical protein
MLIASHVSTVKTNTQSFLIDVKKRIGGLAIGIRWEIVTKCRIGCDGSLWTRTAENGDGNYEVTPFMDQGRWYDNGVENWNTGEWGFFYEFDRPFKTNCRIMGHDALAAYRTGREWIISGFQAVGSETGAPV